MNMWSKMKKKMPNPTQVGIKKFKCMYTIFLSLKMTIGVGLSQPMWNQEQRYQ